MTERHTIHLPVIRYRDKAGNPTCAADFDRKHLAKLAEVLGLEIADLLPRIQPDLGANQ